MRRTALAALLLLPLAAIGAVLYLVSATGESSSAEALPAPRSPKLPDLVMPPLKDVLLARRDDGSRRVFFTAAIANVGKGPLILHAERKGRSDRWVLRQRFQEPGGGVSEQLVSGDLVFGGHGHNHWHVRLGASYALYAGGPRGPVVRRLVKAGFCFFDHSRFRPKLPGAPRYPVYSARGCAGIAASTVEMGLSVGWTDPYTWLLPDQRIEVTGVPDGVYRLVATADPDGWFDETVETNNSAWVDIRLGTRPDGIPTVTVLRRSPPPP